MQARAKVTRDTVVASASVQRTPRVGIVLSSYKGGSDHFGNAKFEGLAEPRAPSEELNAKQIAAMTRHAIRLGNHPNRGFRRVLSANESVVLLASRYAEAVVVSTVADMIREESAGSRVTILSPDAAAAADRVRMPAPGIWSRRDVEYHVPKIVLECDRLIYDRSSPDREWAAIAALDTYRMLASAEDGAQGTPDVVAMDLYGFHPAEYAIVGGTQVLRDGSRSRHNLVLAGPMPFAVDAVGAAFSISNPSRCRCCSSLANADSANRVSTRSGRWATKSKTHA